jgi:hypothetical protein
LALLFQVYTIEKIWLDENNHEKDYWTRWSKVFAAEASDQYMPILRGLFHSSSIIDAYNCLPLGCNRTVYFS